MARPEGIIGIRVHRLRDGLRSQDRQGRNPFSAFELGAAAWKVPYDSVVPVYDPPYVASKDVHACIAENLEGWAQEGIRVRSRW